MSENDWPAARPTMDEINDAFRRMTDALNSPPSPTLADQLAAVTSTVPASHDDMLSALNLARYAPPPKARPSGWGELGFRVRFTYRGRSDGSRRWWKTQAARLWKILTFPAWRWQ